MTPFVVPPLSIFYQKGFTKCPKIRLRFLNKITYTGYILTPGQRKLSAKKTDKIYHQGPPKTKEQLRAFLEI